jgi:hypothetical protein
MNILEKMDALEGLVYFSSRWSVGASSMTSKEKFAELKTREIEGSEPRNKILLPSYSSRCNCCQVFLRICWLQLKVVLTTSNRGPSTPGVLFRFCARNCVLNTIPPCFAWTYVGCHVKVFTLYFLTLWYYASILTFHYHNYPQLLLITRW